MSALRSFIILGCCCLFLQSCIYPTPARVSHPKEARFSLRGTELSKKLQVRAHRDEVLLAFGRPQQVDIEERSFYYLSLQTGCHQLGVIILFFPEDFDVGDVFYLDYISKLQFDEHWHLIGYQRYRVKRRQEHGVDASAGKVDESYYINIKQHCIPKYLNYQKRAAGE